MAPLDFNKEWTASNFPTRQPIASKESNVPSPAVEVHLPELTAEDVVMLLGPVTVYYDWSLLAEGLEEYDHGPSPSHPSTPVYQEVSSIYVSMDCVYM